MKESRHGIRESVRKDEREKDECEVEVGEWRRADEVK